MPDILPAIQERLNREAALHDPPEALYAPSPGQLLDHVHHRIAKIVTSVVDERTQFEGTLLHLLQSERKRWDVIRQYAGEVGDQKLMTAMDAATADYVERNQENNIEPDGWVWRPKASDGRWQFRRHLEGRGYGPEVQVVPVLMLDQWVTVDRS